MNRYQEHQERIAYNVPRTRGDEPLLRHDRAACP